jgi:hypothetical protein
MVEMEPGMVQDSLSPVVYFCCRDLSIQKGRSDILSIRVIEIDDTIEIFGCTERAFEFFPTLSGKAIHHMGFEVYSGVTLSHPLDKPEYILDIVMTLHQSYNSV